MKSVYVGVLGLCLALALPLTGCGKEAVTVILLPGDADLGAGPDLIVEPAEPPITWATG